jgi:hypothetical protein
VVAATRSAPELRHPHRHLFMNRQDRSPTCLLLDRSGNVVRVYRDRIDVDRIERRARSTCLPDSARSISPGTFYSGPLPATTRPTAGTPRRWTREAAVIAFERAAQRTRAPRRCRPGTPLARGGDGPGPRRVRARPALQPIWPKPTTIRSPLRRAAISTVDRPVSRGAGVDPDYPDALNNLGYALLLSGHDEEVAPTKRRWRSSRTFRSAEQPGPVVWPGGRHGSSGALFPERSAAGRIREANNPRSCSCHEGRRTGGRRSSRRASGHRSMRRPT